MRIALVGLCLSALVACKTASDSASLKDEEVATASRLETDLFHFPGDLNVRVGQQMPAGAVKADLLFLPGFADRLDNHGPLFDAWAAQGLRVISFDYPSHGETTGPGLDTFGGIKGPFHGLTSLASQVEVATRQDENRPLILAGWSTGGLLAVRLLQGVTLAHLERTPTAVILLAPGVAVRPLVGDHGTVTQDTLTNNPNPPHMGPIMPTSPTSLPVFAAALLANAATAWAETYPSVPTLVVLADDDADKYVMTSKVRDWVGVERSVHAAKITGIQCAGAKHELDNEPDPTGASVRAAVAQFAAGAVGGRGDPTADPGSCAGF